MHLALYWAGLILQVFKSLVQLLGSEACQASKIVQLVRASMRTQVQIPVTHVESKVKLSQEPQNCTRISVSCGLLIQRQVQGKFLFHENEADCDRARHLVASSALCMHAAACICAHILCTLRHTLQELDQQGMQNSSY